MAIVNDEQVTKVLRQYNPWWRTPSAIKEESKPQKRLAYYEALKTLTHKSIRRFAVLSGMRRVGKTTIPVSYTHLNLTRITDIMEVMESQIGPLKQQSENARTYLKLSARLKQLEVNRFIGEYERLKGQDEETGQRLTQLEGCLLYPSRCV